MWWIIATTSLFVLLVVIAILWLRHDRWDNHSMIVHNKGTVPASVAAKYFQESNEKGEEK